MKRWMSYFSCAVSLCALLSLPVLTAAAEETTEVSDISTTTASLTVADFETTTSIAESTTTVDQTATTTAEAVTSATTTTVMTTTTTVTTTTTTVTTSTTVTERKRVSEVEKNGVCYTIYSDKTAQLTDCDWSTTSVVIPEMIEHCPVTSIADYAFEKCNLLESVVISKTVRSIGDRAFEYCISLESVFIPENVTHIGNSVFFGCKKMRFFEVDAENPVYMTIDGVLFAKKPFTLLAYPMDKPGMSYTVPKGVTVIAAYAFARNTWLTSVKLPEGLYEIQDSAFRECANLSDITLPSTVRVLGYGTFDRCRMICYLEIPDGVTHIPSGFMWANSGPLEIVIPPSVKTFGSEVFSYTDVIIYGEPGSAAELYVYDPEKVQIEGCQVFETLTFIPISQKPTVTVPTDPTVKPSYPTSPQTGDVAWLFMLCVTMGTVGAVCATHKLRIQ